ncbi:hypothetical protein [Rhodohalobacter halophilus]|uniref:hypothetical protein n=1 Tax=Rhodohalobacter halophilus TaxID=1812810 RepID=UPI00083F8479|nr:hypothetical protein [Rhodohalobacter halophilus]
MNTKQEIINKINRIDDPELLLEIDRWISSILNSSVPEEFLKEEINAVREGYNQFKAGDVLPQEKANKLFDQWLKEK